MLNGYPTGMRSCVTLLLFSWVAAAQTSPAGKWLSNLKFFDEPNYSHLQLELNGSKLTGKLGNDAFDGTFQNARIDGMVKPNPRTTIQLRGTVQNERIEGTGRCGSSQMARPYHSTRSMARL